VDMPTYPLVLVFNGDQKWGYALQVRNIYVGSTSNCLFCGRQIIGRCGLIQQRGGLSSFSLGLTYYVRERVSVFYLAPVDFTGRGLPRPGSARTPPGAGVPNTGFAPPVYIVTSQKNRSRAFILSPQDFVTCQFLPPPR
jgi:hypothetical protein